MIESVGIKIILAAGSFVAAGWGAHEYLTTSYAERNFVLVMDQRQQYILELQIERIVKQIAHLERIPIKSPTELEQLRYLREKLSNIRRVQRGRQ